jgi:chromosomal replication initiation ATPase DnaA
MTNISNEIIKTISNCFSIPADALFNESTKRPYPELRRIYYYIMSVNTNLSLGEIGKPFGQTYANVSISLRKFRLDIRVNDDFKELFNEVNNNLPNQYKVYLIN